MLKIDSATNFDTTPVRPFGKSRQNVTLYKHNPILSDGPSSRPGSHQTRQARPLLLPADHDLPTTTLARQSEESARDLSHLASPPLSILQSKSAGRRNLPGSSPPCLQRQRTRPSSSASNNHQVVRPASLASSHRTGFSRMAATQARTERQISELLRRPGNDVCADCSSPSVRRHHASRSSCDAF